MLKEGSILGDDDRVAQIIRHIVKADHPAFRSLTPGNGTYEFRLQLRFLEMPAVLPVSESDDRFSGAIEFDSHLRIRARVINERVRARIDIDHRSAHGVSATIAV